MELLVLVPGGFGRQFKRSLWLHRFWAMIAPPTASITVRRHIFFQVRGKPLDSPSLTARRSVLPATWANAAA